MKLVMQTWELELARVNGETTSFGSDHAPAPGARTGSLNLGGF